MATIDSLGAFARENADTRRVHIVETPLILVRGQTRAPHRFTVEAFLERDATWRKAMEPRHDTLVLYERDHPFCMGFRSSKNAKSILEEVRQDIAAILAKRNPQALIAEQTQPAGLDWRWVPIVPIESEKRDERPALIAKARHVTGTGKPLLCGTLFGGGEWVLRDADTNLTLAAPWEPGVETLRKWLLANPGNTRGWHFLADALRGGHCLHERGLLFMDWSDRNVAVNPEDETGWLFDHEAVISTGGTPFLLSSTVLAEIVQGSPKPETVPMTPQHDKIAAAACIEEVAQGFPPPVVVEANRISLQLRVDHIGLAQAAELLDNLAV